MPKIIGAAVVGHSKQHVVRMANVAVHQLEWGLGSVCPAVSDALWL